MKTSAIQTQENPQGVWNKTISKVIKTKELAMLQCAPDTVYQTRVCLVVFKSEINIFSVHQIWCTRQDSQRACRRCLKHLYSPDMSGVPLDMAQDKIHRDNINWVWEAEYSWTCPVYHQMGYLERYIVHLILYSPDVSNVASMCISKTYINDWF